MNDGRIFKESCPWAAFSKQAFGLADGAYGNRPRLVIPCRKAGGTLTGAGASYNNVHSFYRARIEQTFAFFWTFSFVRNGWRGREEVGAERFFRYLKVFINFANFYLRRNVRYEPYGPWSHFPEGEASSTGSNEASSSVDH